MGQLVNGQWQTDELLQKTSDGKFVRKASHFRNWITPDGSAGPTGTDGFKAESGRYHLYISHACPWAHRTAIFRKLKGLEDIISISSTHWLMGDMGWTFKGDEDSVQDPINGADYLHQIYQLADPDYTGRATVPILWDKQRETIVSNESAEIIRMFNSAFDQLGAAQGDYYPVELRQEIDQINERVYVSLNNGVYKSGFAQSQEAYEEAVFPLFETLEWLENRLSENRYLVGSVLTEADWRLFTTLIRFDPVYYGHFKCNLKRIVDYPNLYNYLRELHQMDGVRETVNMQHIKRHYYGSHDSINPTRIVPVGPLQDLDAPHDRDRFEKVAIPVTAGI
ncbi:glutathione S-transferase family protein [Sneathiella glossodoripedis]|uniref:glutathione S-transferase family protein n=1 Tax=Sneathiella glossodoripedis TaxID=418853 RepID=UPI000471DA3E|nr:glutathione S-transferase family protein [Sneathiella glossodoripedis]